jgi:hypothetical protein
LPAVTKVIEELERDGMGKVSKVRDTAACFSRVHNLEHIIF